MGISEASTKLQEQTVTALRANQEVVLNMVKPLVPVFEPFVAMVRIPLAGELPATSEVINGWFDFAVEVMKANRDFTLKLVDLFPGPPERPPVVKPTAKAA
jgi:hypothetical protein